MLLFQTSVTLITRKFCLWNLIDQRELQSQNGKPTDGEKEIVRMSTKTNRRRKRRKEKRGRKGKREICWRQIKLYNFYPYFQVCASSQTRTRFNKTETNVQNVIQVWTNGSILYAPLFFQNTSKADDFLFYLTPLLEKGLTLKLCVGWKI